MVRSHIQNGYQSCISSLCPGNASKPLATLRSDASSPAAYRGAGRNLPTVLSGSKLSAVTAKPVKYGTLPWHTLMALEGSVEVPLIYRECRKNIFLIIVKIRWKISTFRVVVMSHHSSPWWSHGKVPSGKHRSASQSTLHLYLDHINPSSGVFCHHSIYK